MIHRHQSLINLEIWSFLVKVEDTLFKATWMQGQAAALTCIMLVEVETHFCLNNCLICRFFIIYIYISSNSDIRIFVFKETICDTITQLEDFIYSQSLYNFRKQFFFPFNILAVTLLGYAR